MFLETSFFESSERETCFVETEKYFGRGKKSGEIYLNKSILPSPRQHSGECTSLSIFSEALVAGYSSGHLAVFDLRTNALVRLVRNAHVFPIHVLACFRQNGVQVLSGDTSGRVCTTSLQESGETQCLVESSSDESILKILVLSFQRRDKTSTLLGLVATSYVSLVELNYHTNQALVIRKFNFDEKDLYLPSACFLQSESPPNYASSQYLVLVYGLNIQVEEVKLEDSIICETLYSIQWRSRVDGVFSLKAQIFSVLDETGISLLQLSRDEEMKYFVLGEKKLDGDELVSFNVLEYSRLRTGNRRLRFSKSFHKSCCSVEIQTQIKRPTRKLVFHLLSGRLQFRILGWPKYLDSLLKQDPREVLQTFQKLYLNQLPGLLDFPDNFLARKKSIQRQVRRIVETYSEFKSESEIETVLRTLASVELSDLVYSLKKKLGDEYFWCIEKLVYENLLPDFEESSIYKISLDFFQKNQRLEYFLGRSSMKRNRIVPELEKVVEKILLNEESDAEDILIYCTNNDNFFQLIDVERVLQNESFVELEIVLLKKMKDSRLIEVLLKRKISDFELLEFCLDLDLEKFYESLGNFETFVDLENLIDLIKKSLPEKPKKLLHELEKTEFLRDRVFDLIFDETKLLHETGDFETSETSWASPKGPIFYLDFDLYRDTVKKHTLHLVKKDDEKLLRFLVNIENLENLDFKIEGPCRHLISSFKNFEETKKNLISDFRSAKSDEEIKILLLVGVQISLLLRNDEDLWTQLILSSRNLSQKTQRLVLDLGLRFLKISGQLEFIQKLENRDFTKQLLLRASFELDYNLPCASLALQLAERDTASAFTSFQDRVRRGKIF